MRFPWSKKQESLVLRCGEIRNTIFKALGDLENPAPKRAKPRRAEVHLTNGRYWSFEESGNITIKREGKYLRVYNNDTLQYEVLNSRVTEIARRVDR